MKRRIICILTVVFFMSVFMTGCFAKNDTSKEAEAVTIHQIGNGFLVWSDKPAPVYSAGDSFVYHGFSNPESLSLVKLNPPKGALPIVFEMVFDKEGKLTIKEFESFSTMEEKSMITDKNGNEIGDLWNNMYNLNPGETYKVRVEEEAGVYEEELTADWLFYSCDDFKNATDIYATKHAKYDISSLSPGYYAVNYGTYDVIEIR